MDNLWVAQNVVAHGLLRNAAAPSDSFISPVVLTFLLLPPDANLKHLSAFFSWH